MPWGLLIWLAVGFFSTLYVLKVVLPRLELAFPPAEARVAQIVGTIVAPAGVIAAVVSSVLLFLVWLYPPESDDLG